MTPTIDLTVPSMDGSLEPPPERRRPHVSAVRTWPADGQPLRVIWGDGRVAYAVHPDGHLLSTNTSGTDWSRLHTAAPTAPMPGYKDIFMPIPGTSPQRIVASGNAGTFTSPLMQPMVSTNNGATWTNATSGPLVRNEQPLGATSLGRDPLTGHLYFGTYFVSGHDQVTELRLYRSTDQGTSWSVFHTFPGLRSTTGRPVTRHIHSCTWDQYSQRMYFAVGDLNPGGGLYRTTADGSTVEPVLTNQQVANYAACMIDPMFFPNHIVWGTDNSSELGIFRMARTEIGNPDPTLEKTFRTNASNWWSWPLNPQGTRWMLSGSNDSAYNNLDTACHLYVVDEDGLSVHEAGTIPGQGESGGPISAQCVGPRDGKGQFWLNTRFFTSNISGLFAATFSTGMAITGRETRDVGATPSERITGHAVIPAGGSVTVGHLRVPRRRTDLVVFDMGVYKTEGAGAAQILVTDEQGNTVGGIATSTYAMSYDIGPMAPWWTRAENLVPGQILLVKLRERSGTGSVSATGYLTSQFEVNRRFDFDWSFNGL